MKLKASIACLVFFIVNCQLSIVNCKAQPPKYSNEFLSIGVDNIPDTSELIDPSGNIDYSRLKSFSAADYAFLFSYAFRTKVQGLQLGGSAKIIHRNVGDFAHAWGFGLDAGAQYERGKWIF